MRVRNVCALFLGVAAIVTDAAVLQLYSDNARADPAGQVNVWDNTCALTGGFQSFKLLVLGGDGGESNGQYPLPNRSQHTVGMPAWCHTPAA